MTSKTGEQSAACGFGPIVATNTRVLILGSLPGQQSLQAQQYYAHPRNSFWHIMQALFGVEGNYLERCKGLQHAGIAVWDVLSESVRPGSLDASIRMDTARVNDFVTFAAEQPNLELIVFNGAKAEQLFRRLAALPEGSGIQLQRLPSTSPANAAMSVEAKLAAWHRALADYARPSATIGARPKEG